ncbi:MAG: hypothetical protein AAFW46_18615, partial [Pseudomonadota bacterium]
MADFNLDVHAISEGEFRQAVLFSAPITLPPTTPVVVSVPGDRLLTTALTGATLAAQGAAGD